MEYLRVNITLKGGESFHQDILIDALGQIGFDTFEDLPDGFSAYIPAQEFNEEALKSCINELNEGITANYAIEQMPEENWNAEWEKNFPPLIVSDQIYVRASFHEPKPTFPYEIVIDPKMAFGTGHHQTTTLMMQYILQFNPDGEHVLDMGCGTGILAILAAKRGAKRIVAIDYDNLSYDSTLENAATNNTPQVIALCGSKEAIPKEVFQTIYANINRNILLDQIPAYAEVLASGGNIFFSGFYETPDLAMIKERCSAYGITYQAHHVNGGWVAAHFKK